MPDPSRLRAALADLARVAEDFTAEDVVSRLVRAAASCLPRDGTDVMVSVPDGQCLARSRSASVSLRSVTAIPLHARGERWGVLTVDRSRPGRLELDELAALHALANVAASYLVVAADRQLARLRQDQLTQQATRDHLTRLPVRGVLHEQLGRALRGLSRRKDDAVVGVLFLDLDGLKAINDTYGHAVGDDVLCAFSARVRRALRPTDVLARTGGDEFVVLLEEIENADAAMYRAKRMGPGRAEVFDPAAYDRCPRIGASPDGLFQHRMHQ